MPVSINNTQIVFNDATVQTTAFTGGGGVTSLNSQTGAVVTTNFDSIGGTGVFMMGTNTNLGYNGTIAGSNLRYNYGSNGGGSPFNSSWVAEGFSYGGGGTAPAGTWRKLSTGNTYYTEVDTFGNWVVHYYVRIS